MRRTPFRALVFILLIGLTFSADVLGRQFDPLKRVREKMGKLQKKIECAVNDKACIEKAKQDGAEVTTTPPVPAPGAPQAPGATPQKPGTAAMTAAPLNAAFTSTPLAPYTTMPTMLETVVSDDGARAAGVAMRGSRYVVVVDGQDGPMFDQILASSNIGHQSGVITGSATFSPGGKRGAYVGIRAGASIAVIDGKEGPPFSSIDNGAMRKTGAFHFSSDGSRVAYIGLTVDPAKPGPPAHQVVLDGTPGPRYMRIAHMIFAGTRHAYIAQTLDNKTVLVIDGKEQSSPYQPRQTDMLLGNKDGHIAYVGWNTDNTWSVTVDGVQGRIHRSPNEDLDGHINLVLAPTGNRVAYVVRRSATPGNNSDLYVDGKVVRSSAGFQHVKFSPDGRRIAGAFLEQGAAAGPMLRMRTKVFVDDWTSQDYAGVADGPVQAAAGYSPIVFSPDSKRFACIVSNGPAFAIVDGKESPGYARIEEFRFSPNSQHYAFQAGVLNPGGGFGHWLIVVDGKEGPKLIEVKRGSLTFSPDGSRVAYAGMTGFSSSIAVIDGQEHKIGVAGFQPRLPKMMLGWGRPLIDRAFVFSRDGKRLAYVNATHSSGQPGAGSVMIDGQPTVPSQLASLPTFSPDGKRFAHIVWLNQKWLLAVDGKSAPIDGEVYEAPNSLAFQDDGSVRFLVAKDNMLHRVVVRTKEGTN